ncbi:Trihelix transcription factor ASR3, partial [Ananas comosus]
RRRRRRRQREAAAAAAVDEAGDTGADTREEGGGGEGGGRGRPGGAEGGGGRQQLEPKWAAVAGYCRRHGVDRGPVQCRKRWSNLAGDYKKIKEWERARGGDRGESFWAMRNDLRRERRLPGFFDREVYDILDGVAAAASGEEKDEEIEEEEEEAAAAAAEKKRRRRKKKTEEEAEEGEAEVEEAVFDSGRTAAEDGLFSDSEEEEAVAVAVTAAAARGGEEAEERSVLPPTTATAAAVPVVAMPISDAEKKYEAPHQESIEPGTSKDKQPAHDTENEGHKRKRASTDEGETNVESQLIDVLERNSRMLSAQLEAQNLNSQLDREQRKDQTNSLLVILNKLADALGKIADKL